MRGPVAGAAPFRIRCGRSVALQAAQRLQHRHPALSQHHAVPIGVAAIEGIKRGLQNGPARVLAGFRMRAQPVAATQRLHHVGKGWVPNSSAISVGVDVGQAS